MSPGWFLLLGIATPPAQTAANTPAAVVQMDREQLRDEYRRLMRATAERAKPDPHELTPELVALYAALGQDVDGMTHAEQRRKRLGMKRRLEEMRDLLIRQQLRDKRDARRRTGDATGEQVLAGGGEARNAADLIQLIQTTIQPDTWDINGGRSTMYYFPLLHALVVRAPSEVHHELGGTLEVLRKLQ